METFTHNFTGFWGCDSKCKVHKTEIHGITHICFEELDDNEGTSVTNMSEHLATEMVQRFNLVPGKCKFFESYPDNRHRKDRSFDEILYTWNGNKASQPNWLPAKNMEIFGF